MGTEGHILPAIPVTFPVIGTLFDGRVLYVPQMKQPYYWQDAAILGKCAKLAFSSIIDFIKVTDDTLLNKPTYIGGEPVYQKVIKIHEVPTCVIEAYKEFLCN